MKVFHPDAQVYCLAMEQIEECDLVVGSLGEVRLDRGWIYYVGRARNGWNSRMKRLTRPKPDPWWHVDYLLSNDSTRTSHLCPLPVEPNKECRVARSIQTLSKVPVHRNFGASDCTEGCIAHGWVAKQPPDETFGNLKERGFPVTGWIKFFPDRSKWITSQQKVSTEVENS